MFKGPGPSGFGLFRVRWGLEHISTGMFNDIEALKCFRRKRYNLMHGEPTKKYEYQTVMATRTNQGDSTLNMVGHLNSLGAQGYRFVGTFTLPSPAVPDEFLLMEKATTIVAGPSREPDLGI